MSVIVNFTVPASKFVLSDVFDGFGAVRVESIVPTGSDVVPLVWIEGDVTAASLERAVDHPLVADVRRIDAVEGWTLCRVRWTDELNGLVGALVVTDGVVLSAASRDDVWAFEVRFDEETHLSTFHEQCGDRSIPLTVTRVYEPSGTDRSAAYGLTETQHETLETAMTAGYFAVPRQTTLTELGELLGISDSAVSQRLRRGIATLVANTLAEGHSDPS